MGMLPRIASLVLLFLGLTFGLSACATPSTLLEATVLLVERQSDARLLPTMPAELVREVLVALDRGDLGAARALFAPGAPRPNDALAQLAAIWPGDIFGQPRASLSIGPYQTRERLALVAPGQIEAIPVAGRCPSGSFEARLIVQMTPDGWRLFDVR